MAASNNNNSNNNSHNNTAMSHGEHWAAAVEMAAAASASCEQRSANDRAAAISAATAAIAAAASTARAARSLIRGMAQADLPAGTEGAAPASAGSGPASPSAAEVALCRNHSENSFETPPRPQLLAASQVFAANSSSSDAVVQKLRQEVEDLRSELRQVKAAMRSNNGRQRAQDEEEELGELGDRSNRSESEDIFNSYRLDGFRMSPTSSPTSRRSPRGQGMLFTSWAQDVGAGRHSRGSSIGSAVLAGSPRMAIGKSLSGTLRVDEEEAVVQEEDQHLNGNVRAAMAIFDGDGARVRSDADYMKQIEGDERERPSYGCGGALCAPLDAENLDNSFVSDDAMTRETPRSCVLARPELSCFPGQQQQHRVLPPPNHSLTAITGGPGLSRSQQASLGASQRLPRPSGTAADRGAGCDSAGSRSSGSLSPPVPPTRRACSRSAALALPAASGLLTGTGFGFAEPAATSASEPLSSRFKVGASASDSRRPSLSVERRLSGPPGACRISGAWATRLSGAGLLAGPPPQVQCGTPRSVQCGSFCPGPPGQQWWGTSSHSLAGSTSPAMNVTVRRAPSSTVASSRAPSEESVRASPGGLLYRRSLSVGSLQRSPAATPPQPPSLIFGPHAVVATLALPVRGGAMSPEGITRSPLLRASPSGGSPLHTRGVVAAQLQWPGYSLMPSVSRASSSSSCGMTQ
ncbi:unnamed protein product, partial [Polarella glacialis]